jgi:FMN phosphatase YigB (HAD superfamily)
LKKIVLFDIDDVLFKTNVFIQSGLKRFESYKDTKEALEKTKERAEVAILSKGEYNLQLTKLKNTGLIDFFDINNIFIVKEKNAEIESAILRFKDYIIFIIEDRLDNLSAIKKVNQKIKTVWIKRGRHKNLVWDYKPDFTINNLNQILKII